MNISLCGSTAFDTKLYVYASDSGCCPPLASDNTGTQIACDDDGCSVPATASEILGLSLNAGVTYWIVVDGSFDGCGFYEINITDCVVPTEPQSWGHVKATYR